MDRGALERYCVVHDIGAIVHLAAKCGGIGINKDHPGSFLHHNLQMGVNVLEASRRLGIRRVVNLGTVCSYPKFASVPFQEDCIWDGYPEETNAPYGIAKKTVMEMGVAYSSEYNMQVVNLVPVNMAGEFDNFNLYSSHVIPALIRKFEEAVAPQNQLQEIELWGTGEASREFLYAGDTARAIAICLQPEFYPGAEPINLGTGQEWKIRDLAERIREVGEYGDIAISWNTDKPDGQPRRCLDVSRAKIRLGWEAEVDLNELLKRTINWYRQEGPL